MTSKRDALLVIQNNVQTDWTDNNAFQTEPEPGREKYFVTFPYPYMNGRLHLGHAFSLSKAEFSAWYQRMLGKNVLFPFSFHCTGMPIKVCADKLAREIDLYGLPPIFPVVEDELEEVKIESTKRKRSKEKTKGSGKKWQWHIMQSLGIPDTEIANFADPQYWIDYFPEYCMKDMQQFGLSVDWRRSFITTDRNPYYDAFIKWQFRLLMSQKRIKFGKRPCIYSLNDGQPCMDHERASGEGVSPQEYTLVKMKLNQVPDLLQLHGADVYLLACTLRPETMYGQTNCWIHPDLTYGVYQENDIYYITNAQSVNNMNHQDHTLVHIMDIQGSDLLGSTLTAPLTSLENIPILPMTTIKPDKGTGIVTSVPSDAPDDWQTLQELGSDIQPIPIINVPEYGTLTAPTLCEQMGITSNKDRNKLDKAKDIAYKKGFHEGTFIIGPYTGSKVEDVKDIIRQELIEGGDAFVYWEPESEVVSRSGDTCVVALCDQWYLNYEDPEWKELVARNIQLLESYHSDTKAKFEATLDWLNGWACSRSYGLGTTFDFEGEEYLIESLSDSTIYMAFYTIAHILQKEVPLHYVNDSVFNYIFLNGVIPNNINLDVLDRMKQEFEYWYPVDLRVSGKDLIGNHLTFYMYNHTSIWPEDKWPKAIRANGHLNLNGKKMSKSTGNFMTLEEACSKYSSDAVRMALAEGGDGLDDGNFEEGSADTAVLRLSVFVKLVEDVMGEFANYRTVDEVVSEDIELFDTVFEVKMNEFITKTQEAFDNCEFREALKMGWHEFSSCRLDYMKKLGTTLPRADLMLKYLERQTLFITPFAPHTCEHVWSLLGNNTSIIQACWPVVTNVSDPYALMKDDYVAHVLHLCHRTMNKKKNYTSVIIQVGKEYIGWQKEMYDIIKSMISEDGQMPSKREVAKAIGKIKYPSKSIKKKSMSTAIEAMTLIEEYGIQVLDEPLFDEEVLLLSMMRYMLDSLRIDCTVEVGETTPMNPKIVFS